MKENTFIADAVEIAKDNAEYDGPLKNILADKSILAWIASCSVKELRGYPIDVIKSCIEGEPEISKVTVAPGQTNEAITGENTEDKVVLMCPPAPGIEKHASDSINILSEYDINFTIFDRDVLRSQHASSEDLKLLYAMLKPQYIIPIKGEYRQMYDHYLVAKSADYDKENINGCFCYGIGNNGFYRIQNISETYKNRKVFCKSKRNAAESR